jgi:NDP-sugar pyrophosphorylase family protein
MMLPVAVLAGGLATRLRPITETIPKALVEVEGRPFVHWQLEYLWGQGVRDVTLCIGHLGEMVRDSVGDGSAFNIRVTYSEDGPLLLGTGGALRAALPLLGQEFFVLYGDSFLPIEFGPVVQAFRKSGKSALMTVLHNSDRLDQSNVWFEGGRMIVYDKRSPVPQMQFIDYGLSALRAEPLLRYAASEVFDLADVFHDLSTRGDLVGHEVHERFYEIGSPSGLEETRRFIRERRK